MVVAVFGFRTTRSVTGSTLAEQRPRTLNERFATAAGQLGSDKQPALRLAGVYAMAANIAADLAASCWLLGLYDCDDLKDAEPDTLRYRLLSLPARVVRHARSRVLKISRTWPWKDAFLTCWARLCTLPAPI